MPSPRLVGSVQAMILDEIVEHAAPFLDGGLERGEVVVGQHHVGRLFGDVGAGDPHGHSDIRLLQGRSVIHPIPGHGDHVAARLKGFHQTQLLFRRDPGEDVRVLGGLDQLGIGVAGQRLPGEDLGRLTRSALGKADLSGDGRRGQGVIAGDHLDPDAGQLRGAHGGDRLGAWGIDHSLQAEQRETVGQVAVTQPRRVGRQDQPGKGQHPQAIGGHLVGGLMRLLGVERHIAAGGVQLAAAAIDQHFGSTFDIGDQFAGLRRTVERCHVLVLGLERNGIHPREARARPGRPGQACRRRRAARPRSGRPAPSSDHPLRTGCCRCTAGRRAGSPAARARGAGAPRRRGG